MTHPVLASAGRWDVKNRGNTIPPTPILVISRAEDVGEMETDRQDAGAMFALRPHLWHEAASLTKLHRITQTL